MSHLKTWTAKSAKGKLALTLLGVLGVFVATAVVYAAKRGPDFTMTVSSSKQSLTAGQPASFPVKIKRLRGFKGAVKLSVSGLPRDASAGSKTIKKNRKSATLKIVTAPTTPGGSFKPTITAKSGRLKHSKKVSLTVTPPAPAGGGTGGLPGGGTGTPTTPAATAEPTFSVNATPSSRTIPDGDFTSFDITIDRSGGYTGAVDLEVTGEPTTGSATVTPASTSGNSATLTIETDSGTTPDTYNLTVTGSGGGKTASKDLTLVVVQSQNFTVADGAPVGLGGALRPGGPAQPLDLTLSNPNGFAITVDSLSVALPSTSDAGCLTSWFPVTQYSGPDLVVPAGAINQSLTALGATQAELPKVAMTNEVATNQDVCKGKTLNFSYSGTATK